MIYFVISWNKAISDEKWDLLLQLPMLYALAKPNGMAGFADVHGGGSLRLEPISRIDSRLRVLDFALVDARTVLLVAVDAKNAYRETLVEH